MNMDWHRTFSKVWFVAENLRKEPCVFQKIKQILSRRKISSIRFKIPSWSVWRIPVLQDTCLIKRRGDTFGVTQVFSNPSHLLDEIFAQGINYLEEEDACQNFLGDNIVNCINCFLFQSVTFEEKKGQHPGRDSSNLSIIMYSSLCIRHLWSPQEHKTGRNRC